MKHVARKRKQKTIPNPYNIGFIDRSIRFLIGGVMLGSVFYLTPAAVVSILGYDVMLMKLLSFLSLYPLLTAWLGWDPIYEAMSFDSATQLKEDISADIVDQMKAVTHTK
jgi:hypothetical protein